MDNNLFTNLPADKREQMIADNAERREDFQYARELTQEEINEMKHDLAMESIAYAKLEEKKKEAIADFKFQMDPIKEEKSRLLKLLRTKVQEVDEKVYLIADFEEEQMGYYSKEGKLVHQRPLKANEKQFRLTHNSKQQ